MPTKKTWLDTMKKSFKAGKNNAAVLAELVKTHPHSRMTKASVNWYRNRFRADGLDIPSEHELKG